MPTRAFVTSTAPEGSGWRLGTWSQASETEWVEQKLDNAQDRQSYTVTTGGPASTPGSSTIRLTSIAAPSDFVLLVGDTIQCFSGGAYIGEYLGGWSVDGVSEAAAAQAEAEKAKAAAMAETKAIAMAEAKAAAVAEVKAEAIAEAKASLAAEASEAADTGPVFVPAASKKKKNQKPRLARQKTEAIVPRSTKKPNLSKDPKMVEKLKAAVIAKDVDMVGELCREVDPDVATGGKTPLLLATELGLVKAVEFLLDANADVNLADTKGTTPMTAAYSKGNKELLALLFKANFQSLEGNLAGSTGPTSIQAPEAADSDEEQELSMVAVDQLQDVTRRLAAVGQPFQEHGQCKKRMNMETGSDGCMSPKSAPTSPVGDADIQQEERIKDVMTGMVRQACR